MTVPTRNNQGFTLLELLSAFALVLLIATMLFDGLRFGNRAWDISDKTLKTQDEATFSREVLSDWIENTYPFLFLQDTAKLDFSGQAHRLKIISPIGINLGGDRLTRIIFEHDRSSEQFIAVLIDINNGQRIERVLLEGIDAVEMSYFGTSETTNLQQWHSTWENKLTLPKLVKISISFADKKKPVWVELIIQTRIDWGATCLFDAAAGVCRRVSS